MLSARLESRTLIFVAGAAIVLVGYLVMLGLPTAATYDELYDLSLGEQFAHAPELIHVGETEHGFPLLIGFVSKLFGPFREMNQLALVGKMLTALFGLLSFGYLSLCVVKLTQNVDCPDRKILAATMCTAIFATNVPMYEAVSGIKPTFAFGWCILAVAYHMASLFEAKQRRPVLQAVLLGTFLAFSKYIRNEGHVLIAAAIVLFAWEYYRCREERPLLRKTAGVTFGVMMLILLPDLVYRLTETGSFVNVWENLNKSDPGVPFSLENYLQRAVFHINFMRVRLLAFVQIMGVPAALGAVYYALTNRHHIGRIVVLYVILFIAAHFLWLKDFPSISYHQVRQDFLATRRSNESIPVGPFPRYFLPLIGTTALFAGLTAADLLARVPAPRRRSLVAITLGSMAIVSMMELSYLHRDYVEMVHPVLTTYQDLTFFDGVRRLVPVDASVFLQPGFKLDENGRGWMGAWRSYEIYDGQREGYLVGDSKLDTEPPAGYKLIWQKRDLRLFAFSGE